MSWKKDLEKKYGGNVFRSASEVVAKHKQIVNTGPILDVALSGGVPKGSWVILSGPPKAGKSSLALQIAANAQNQFKMKTYYSSIEGRFKEMNCRIDGLNTTDLDKFEIIESTKGLILKAEDYLNINSDLIQNEGNIVVILDSTSALCAQSEYDEDIKAAGRNNGPKLLASFTRKLANIVPVQESIVICIQHMIANTSGYGAPYMEDGGQKIKYQMDIKLRAKTFKEWLDKNNKRVGQLVTWEVINSALGPPGAKVDSYLRYNHGIDGYMEVLQLAIDFGIVNKGGAWLSYTFGGEELKIQGQEKMLEKLMQTPDLYQAIYQEVMKIL